MSHCTLLLTARNMEYKEEEKEYIDCDVLCLWPPPPSSRPPPLLPPWWGDTFPAVVPWHFKEPCFPEKMWPAKFYPRLNFTSNGHAFWADLAQGVLCCRCSDVFSGGYSVNFSFIDLPPGCKCDTLYVSGNGPPEKLRTMGCTSGGSIKFVSISFDDSVPVAERTVTEWTLDTATWRWTKSEELRVGSLWEQDFKKRGLPEAEPQYPLLSTEEDGGALYFVLSEPRRKLRDPAVHHMCRFDVGSKRIVLSSRLSWSPYMAIPVPLLGCGFFRYLQSKHLVPVVHGQGKRKLNEN